MSKTNDEPRKTHGPNRRGAPSWPGDNAFDPLFYQKHLDSQHFEVEDPARQDSDGEDLVSDPEEEWYRKEPNCTWHKEQMWPWPQDNKGNSKPPLTI